MPTHIYEYFGLGSPDSNKNFRVGIEVEVENVSIDFNEAKNLVYGWVAKRDGSLRNNGVEFITTSVSNNTTFETHLQSLYTFLDDNYKPSFSERCGLHVHLDARALTLDQLRNLFALYITFEKSLYKFCGKKRENNIFCVPMYKTGYFEEVCDFLFKNVESKQKLGVLVEHWSKYCGINLTRLPDLGSIEFRMLEGTSDLNKVVTWTTLLCSLYEFALKTPHKELLQILLSLNTTSEYLNFGQKVFGKNAQTLLGYRTVQKDIYFGVALLKDSVASQKETHRLILHGDLTKFKASLYYKVISTTEKTEDAELYELSPAQLGKVIKQTREEYSAYEKETLKLSQLKLLVQTIKDEDIIKKLGAADVEKAFTNASKKVKKAGDKYKLASEISKRTTEQQSFIKNPVDFLF